MISECPNDKQIGGLGIHAKCLRGSVLQIEREGGYKKNLGYGMEQQFLQ